jgi:hypothetical protein
VSARICTVQYQGCHQKVSENNVPEVYRAQFKVTHRTINRIDYRSAFLACRTNRIDLNILYDEDPQLFNDHVDTFLSQVHEVDHINLFLSNLRNEDVTVTMYPKVGARPEASAAAATPTTSPR